MLLQLTDDGCDMIATDDVSITVTIYIVELCAYG